MIAGFRRRWQVAVFLCHPLELLGILLAAGAPLLGALTYRAFLVSAGLGVTGAAMRHAWIAASLWLGLLAWLVVDGPQLATLPTLAPAPFW